MTEWLKVIDCKSIEKFLHGFESRFLYFKTKTVLEKGQTLVLI